MTTNPATRPFWVVVGSGIDVRGIDVLGQIFDFSGIEKSEKSIKKTWQEFRDALSKGDFSFDDIASAKKNTFLRVYDDLFNKNAGIEYNTVLISALSIPVMLLPIQKQQNGTADSQWARMPYHSRRIYCFLFI